MAQSVIVFGIAAFAVVSIIDTPAASTHNWPVNHGIHGAPVFSGYRRNGYRFWVSYQTIPGDA